MKIVKGFLKSIVIVLMLVSVLLSSTYAQNSYLTQLENSLGALSDFQSKLKNPSNKAGRPVGTKIKSFLRNINSAIDQEPDLCQKKVQSSVDRLNKAFALLEKKACSDSRKVNCVSQALISTFNGDFGFNFQDSESVSEFFLTDGDGDGIIDICAGDIDSDLVENSEDNCPYVPNPLQKDINDDGVGDSCDLFVCCDSIESADKDTCSKKTLRSCREDELVIIDCMKPITSSSILFQTDTPPSGGTAGDSGTTGDSMTETMAETQEEFEDRLEEALNMSMVASMDYSEDYDCDDFAGDLEEELEGQGFMATFTAIWTDDGSDSVPGHALTDVHGPNGIVWIEPQTGDIVDLDEDDDGSVMASDGTHSDEFMASEGMSQIEVYDDKDSASMAGVPVD